VNSKADSISAWGAAQARKGGSSLQLNGEHPSPAAKSSGNGSSPSGQGDSKQPVLVVGSAVAAGDAMSLAAAAAEVAASREAINVLQLSLDEADL
jgi:hypothetical protein